MIKAKEVINLIMRRAWGRLEREYVGGPERGKRRGELITSILFKNVLKRKKRK